MQESGAGRSPGPRLEPGTGTGKATGLARNVGVMALTSGLNVGSMVLWTPIYSLILRDLGASDLVIGMGSAASMVLSALLRYAGGRLTDRFGRVPLLVWPGALSAAAVFAAAAARSWHLFVLFYAIYMGGQALGDPVFAAIIGESVPAAERGRAFGLVEFSISAGVVAGPLAGALMLPLFGAPGLLIACGLCLCVTVVLRRAFIRETRRPGGPAAAFGLRHLLEPRMVRVMAIIVLVNLLFVLNTWGPFLSLHAADAMGLDKPSINMLASAGAAAGLAVSFLAGRAVGRWGAQRVLRLASFALGGVVLVWSLQRAYLGILGFYLLMMMAFQAAIIALDTYRVHAVDDEVRGSALGAIGMLTGLFTAPIVPLASYLREVLGSGAPFVLGLLPAAAAVWLLGRPELAAVEHRTAVAAGGL